MRIRAGEVIAGRYRVERELARGGMGVVFVAQHLETEERVALKVLLGEGMESQDALERFRLEARVFARVANDHIVRVLDAGVDEERSVAYIVMELLDGETLDDLIQRRQELDPKTTVALLAQVAVALDRAHAHEGAPIVHRDLKPANIFVAKDGHVTVLDFGIAKLASATAKVSVEIRGTPIYMSIEQIEALPITPATDIFALGLIAFQCLTGKVYWRVANQTDIRLPSLLREIQTGTEVASASARSRELGATASLSTAFDEWFAKCTHREPEDRFASAGAAITKLSTALDLDLQTVSRTLEAPPTSLPRATGSSKKASTRAPWLFGIATAVAAVCIWLGTKPSTTKSETSDAGQADGALPRRGIAVTDHPAPKTAVPAAAAAYAAGQVGIRDADGDFAVQSFKRAVMLDPSLAQAHLRIALHGPTDNSVLPAEVREAYRAAARNRDALDERDRMLLAAAECYTAPEMDFPEFAKRMRAVVARFPDDAEAQYFLANAVYWTGALDEGHAALRKAVELDPSFASPWGWEAVWALQLRHYDDALRALDHCFAASKTASGCVYIRAWLNETRGDCAAVETDARRFIELEPSVPLAYELLARALASRGKPIQSVRSALDRMVQVGTDGSRTQGRASADYWLATLAGDLTSAESALRAFDKSISLEDNPEYHEAVAASLYEIAMERGESEAAASRFLAESQKTSAAYLDIAPTGLSMRRLYEMRRQHRLSTEDLDRERNSRYVAARKLARWPDGTVETDELWLDVWARGAKTKDEMSETLRELAKRGTPVHDESAILAPFYMSEGRVDEAIARLRPASRQCRAIPDSVNPMGAETLQWIHLRAQLAEAYEVKNDKAAACEEWKSIVDRWSDAKPRSITLEKALARRRALACP